MLKFNKNRLEYIKFFIVSLLFIFINSTIIAASVSTDTNQGKAVFINQVGYLPDQQKWIVASKGGDEFTIVNEDTKEVVFRGKLESFDDQTSDRDVLRGEFTPVKKPGKYHAEVKGAGSSYVFSIGNDVYDNLLKDSLRFYFIQRCGIALQDQETGIRHPVCHSEDAYIAREDGFHKKMDKVNSTGGWHDAGDYGKYSTTTAVTVAQLLTVFELWPEKFSDGQLNIPESGNKIPDILDEAKYGLDWLLTMQRPDGAVYHKIAGRYFPGLSTPDFDMQKRYIYGISSSDTAKFAAVSAIASRVFEKIDPDFSARTKKASLKAWDFLSSNSNFIWDHDDFDDEGSGSYFVVSDFRDRVWAALEISAISGDPKIKGWIETNLNDYYPNAITWRDASLLGFLHYWKSADADKKFKDMIAGRIASMADNYMKSSESSGYRYSLSFDNFSWGSNEDGLSSGISMILANYIKPTAGYLAAAQAQLDFILGQNPLSKCFVSGFGSNPLKSPHNRLTASTGITFPGILAGGPNNKSESGIEPAGKGPFSYTDSQGAFSCNEPAIDYNAALVFVVAAFATAK